jgi:hypothetical protein
MWENDCVPTPVCFMESGFLDITFQTFYVCLLLENFILVSEKCFPFILGGKHFIEVVKILEMSYYLLIISNLVLKLLIAIYFVLNLIFFFNFIS